MTARTEPISSRHVGGPLDATVDIRAVHLTRGTVFQVVAAWHDRGEPPADGQPDTRASHADYYDAASIELAYAISDRATHALAAGTHPDLRAIAGDLKRRDHGLQTLTRSADGAVLLGDTPPDEAAA